MTYFDGVVRSIYSFPSLSVNAASCVYSRISQANASPAPAPYAGPLMHAMVTLGELSIAFRSAIRYRNSSRPARSSLPAWVLVASSSIPVQKNLPLPATIMREMRGSSLAPVTTAVRSFIMDVVKTFLAFGLFKMIFKSSSQRWMRMSSVTETLFHRAVGSLDGFLCGLKDLTGLFLAVSAVPTRLALGLESICEIQSPISTSLAKSTPVWIPALWNM